MTLVSNKGNMTPTVGVRLVATSELDDAWKNAAHLIRLSQKRIDDYEGMADIYDNLASGSQQLWLVSVEDKLRAAMTTVVEQHPRKRILRVLHIGGFDMAIWFEDALTALKVAATRTGCKAIQGDGRLGWVKKVPQYGFKEVTRSYEMEL